MFGPHSWRKASWHQTGWTVCLGGNTWCVFFSYKTKSLFLTFYIKHIQLFKNTMHQLLLIASYRICIPVYFHFRCGWVVCSNQNSIYPLKLVSCEYALRRLTKTIKYIILICICAEKVFTYKTFVVFVEIISIILNICNNLSMQWTNCNKAIVRCVFFIARSVET